MGRRGLDMLKPRLAAIDPKQVLKPAVAAGFNRLLP